MSFAITLIASPKAQTREGYERIVLNDFHETFVSPFVFWRRGTYQNHWRESLERALLGKDTCLITSMYDPANANFIFWWLLYNEGEKVKVRNHLLFLNSLSEPLRAERPYSSIPEYHKKAEEGE